MAATNEERKRYVKEYIRSLAAIEECIEPYKEQKRELRSEFRENGGRGCVQYRTEYVHLNFS